MNATGLTMADIYNTQDTLTNDELDIMRERGKRVRQLRSMAMLKSEELADRAGVSRIAISYWENARKSGLTKAGAKKVIEAIKNENIACTFEWLWQGTGNPPQYVKNAPDDSTPSSIEENVRLIIPSIEKEIELFLNSNKDAVIVKIDTNSISPIFEFHDIVGGVWQPLDSLRADAYCIVTINSINQVRWVRKVKISKMTDLAHLRLTPPSLHKDTKSEKVHLEKVAPIIRMWR